MFNFKHQLRKEVKYVITILIHNNHHFSIYSRLPYGYVIMVTEQTNIFICIPQIYHIYMYFMFCKLFKTSDNKCCQSIPCTISHNETAICCHILHSTTVELLNKSARLAIFCCGMSMSVKCSKMNTRIFSSFDVLVYFVIPLLMINIKCSEHCK